MAAAARAAGRVTKGEPVMRWEDLERYRRAANASFAPGSGCWAGEEKRPAMIVAKDDMLWFLKCADFVKKIGSEASGLTR